MNRRIPVIILALCIALFSGNVAAGSTGSENAALKAGNYLKTQQHDDGGFGAKDSTIMETSIAIIAMKTAGIKLPESKTGKSTIGYLKTNAPQLADSDKNVAVQNTAKIAHLIIALKLAGENPKDFAGTDWVKLLADNKEKATGWYGMYDIDHMWAMLALKSAGEATDSDAVKWLQGRQADNGGYEGDKSAGMGADTNSTALAVQALIAADVKPTDPSVEKAIGFLKTQQNTDGGFLYAMSSQNGTDSDTSSTAWVLQALVAAGEDIESKTWVKAAVTPMGFLMSLQNADGAFAYQKAVPDDSELATAQAIPALMMKPYPIKLAAPPSTTEKLPSEKALFSTGALLWIATGAVAAIAFVAGIGFFILRRRDG